MSIATTALFAITLLNNVSPLTPRYANYLLYTNRTDTDIYETGAFIEEETYATIYPPGYENEEYRLPSFVLNDEIYTYTYYVGLPNMRLHMSRLPAYTQVDYLSLNIVIHDTTATQAYGLFKFPVVDFPLVALSNVLSWSFNIWSGGGVFHASFDAYYYDTNARHNAYYYYEVPKSNRVPNYLPSQSIGLFHESTFATTTDSIYFSGKQTFTIGNGFYETGFTDGWDKGFNHGDVGFDWLTSMFSSMGAILSVRIFGDITIGTVAMISLAFTLVPFVIGLISKGGGK